MAVKTGFLAEAAQAQAQVGEDLVSSRKMEQIALGASAPAGTC